MINSLDYNVKELDIIDVQALDLEDEQTWLHACSSSSSTRDDIDINRWIKECSWFDQDTIDYKQSLDQNISVLENIEYGLQKQKFDSRTFTRPKKRLLRPSLQSVVQGISSTGSGGGQANLLCGSRTITRHPRPIAEGRGASHNGLDSWPGDTSDETEFSSSPYSYGDGPTSYVISKPIQINLSEPAHNLHNTFNKISGSSHRNDSLANMSPPSLVSSIAMDGSGTFNSGTFSRQGSICSRKDITLNDEEEANFEDRTAQNSLHFDMTSSILDDKEMNTSMLSNCHGDSLIGSLPPSLAGSMDSSLINSTFCLQKKDSMESSLINSGTFNTFLEPSEENLPSGKPKFQLRKSFLKPEPDDNFDKFLMLNANCNTEDLRGLSGDLMRSVEKRKCDAYRKDNEKENLSSSINKDDSFLMTDGMSDSFLKETGRESLNITYNKLPQANPLRTRTVTRPQMEMEQTIVLPNQVLSPKHNNQPENNNTFTKKLNGTYDAIPKERETPKRNGTFRKLTPPSIRNVTATLINTDIDDVKDVDPGVVDSNKQCYVSTEKLVNISGAEESTEVSPTEKIAWTMQRRKDSLTMAGGSSDSLEQNSSGSCSPHRVARLNMDDLKHLAYEQEQKLYQVISTPISKPLQREFGSATMLFRQNALSPIPTQPQGMVTSCSSSSGSSNTSISPTGPAASPRRLLPVKRESSAPEIKPKPPTSARMPSPQKSGINALNKSKPPGSYGSDNGLYVSRSAGGSPAKSAIGGLGRLTSGLPASGLLAVGSSGDLRRKSALPASKLRQYSSHKELNRMPPAPRWSALGGLGALRPASRGGLHASNPSLCPAPLIRQASYTLVAKDCGNNMPRRDFAGAAPEGAGREAGGGLSYRQPMRAKHNITNMVVPPSSRPPAVSSQYSKAPSSLRAPSAAASVPQHAIPSVASAPSSQRLPRPSGLPRPSTGIPRKSSLRPPSTYSLAPRPGDQTPDCY